MKMIKLLAALSLGFAAAAASAAPLDSITGDFKMKFSGMTTGTNTLGASNEKTWGVGYVTELVSTTDGTKWQAGDGGQYLYYMLYGIADASTQNNGTNFSIFNEGATGGGADGKIHVDFFRSNVNLNTVYPLYTANPQGRTGFGTYSMFAGFENYLQLELQEKVNADNPLTLGYDESKATLVQTALGLVLPTTGTGNFFANAVGGTAKTQYDTNADLYGYDMHGKFDLSVNRKCNAAGNTAGTCFAGVIDDPVIGTKIPEPASLALFGLGLAGVAALRRRRRAA